MNCLLRSRILSSIAEAERLKGSAPMTAEIIVVFHHDHSRLLSGGYVNAYVQNLYREDLFYADKGFLFWSLNGPDGTEER